MRHLVGEFPDHVRLSSTAFLNVYVSLSGSGNSVPMDLRVPKGGITLDVFIEVGDGLTIVSDRRMSLDVPAEGDSNPVGFRLKATKKPEGPSSIHVEAFNGGTRVGALTLYTVVEDTTAAPTGPQLTKAAVQRLGRREGDVTLLLPIENDAYVFYWQDEEGTPPPAPMTTTAANLKTLAKEIVHEIEQIVRGDFTFESDVAKRNLRERGIGLWQNLIPSPIQDWFLKRHEKIKRINIISAGDSFPWEMLYPFRGNPRFDRGFLVEQVEICRWVYGSLPPMMIPLRRADFVSASEGELVKVAEEITTLTDLLRAWDNALKNGEIKEAKELYKLFEDATVSLLHFACHNVVDAKGEQIKIKNTLVTTKDFASCQRNIVDAAAFIFMNACHSDNKPPEYTSIGGWANCFLNTGAGAFIGTLWEVRDSTACIFAKKLYQGLFNEKPLPFGAALRLARDAARQAAPGDPTWLAYSFYGDSDAQLSRSAG